MTQKLALEYQLFKVVQWFYTKLDAVVGFLTGYSIIWGPLVSKMDDAIFTNIIWRAPTSPACFWRSAFVSNMLVKYQRMGKSREILVNDMISLWTVTRTHAVFVLCSENIHNTKKHPFTFTAQYQCAKQLIFISHETLHRLASEVHPKSTLIVIHNTARCGSTLICQMFNQLPRTRVYSEPWSFVVSQGLHLSNTASAKLTESMVKMYLKSDDIRRVVIKMCQLSVTTVPIIKSLFPGAQLIFNTRHPVKSIESFERTLRFVPNSLTAEKADFWFCHLPFLQGMTETERQYFLKRRQLGNIYSLTLGYALSLRVFLENKKLYCYSVLYEDLVECPRDQARKILTCVGIEEGFVDKALKAFKNDSQNGAFRTVPVADRFNNVDWDTSDRLQEEVQSPARHTMSLEQLRHLANVE